MQDCGWNRRSLSPKPRLEIEEKKYSKGMCCDTVEEHICKKFHSVIGTDTSEQVNLDVGLPVEPDSSQQARSSLPSPRPEQDGEFDLKSSCTMEEKGNYQVDDLQKASLDPFIKGTELDAEKLKFSENTATNDELLGQRPNYATLNGSDSQMEPHDKTVTTYNSATTPIESERSHEFDLASGNREPLKNEVVSIQNIKKTEESEKSKSDLKDLELVGGTLEQAPQNISHEPVEQLEQLCDGSPNNSRFHQSGPTHEKASEIFDQVGCSGKVSSVQRRKGKPMAVVGSARVLRSMVETSSKTPEVNNNVEPNNNVTEDSFHQNKRRGKKRAKNLPVNEFSRIKNHLRYVLHRIEYEQNLIDAYSGEGWKGQSLEKIKPEKELQRAKSEIVRCKLKIRELFHRLDLSCSDGKLPASLFDSKGEIDSEDIFCAKCGSKDMTADNDIILCDGSCERGFHQFCLQPPLLKRDIPPGDEGWLCPGCDCKVDCIDLLNDSHGTKLSILDGWEKVFSEAAAAAAAGAAGKLLDNGIELPSDDSEDDDYSPDFQEADEKFQSGSSSSDESELSSESDDLKNSLCEQQFLGLPSDDSEDDDYDPNAVEHAEQPKQESSSSDFTSDSEDLNMFIGDDGSSMSLSNTHFADSSGEKLRAVKKSTLSNEASYLLKSVPSVCSEKRQVERMDYKLLHDEQYGVDSSDSSDEDYSDIAALKRRKSSSETILMELGEAFSFPPEKAASVSIDRNGVKKMMQIETNRIPKKLNKEGPMVSPTSHLEPGSSGKHARSRLGEDATEKLWKSFKENQYPKRTVKEDLAKELGLTVNQVSKWFENARWSFRHSSGTKSSLASASPDKGTLSPQIVKEQPEAAELMQGGDSMFNDTASKQNPEARNRGILVTVDSKGESSGSLKRGRKRDISSSRALSERLSTETANQGMVVGLPVTRQQVRRSGRIQTRSGKSIA